MSKPTKGFFEQGNQNKPRYNQWPKTRNDRPVLSERNTNIAAVPRASIPPTGQSKRKLAAFRYTDDESLNDEKTAVATNTNRAKEEEKKTSNVPGKEQQVSKDGEAKTNASASSPERKVSLPRGNTFPSTPSDRLTLAELIGIPTETNAAVIEEPEEILGWNPNSSGNSPGKKRKRAQSSSPYESPPEPRRSQTNIIQRTPLVDPAAELWQRFGEGKDGSALKLPDLNFAWQASPRPVETPVKGSGLRRWASAGNSWPGSKSKKRRIDRVQEVNVWKQGLQTGQSKVAAMVEKIQKTLEAQELQAEKAAKEQESPSSSSPLPDAGSFVETKKSNQRSPIQHKTTQKEKNTSAPASMKTQQPQNMTTQRPKPSIQAAKSVKPVQSAAPQAATKVKPDQHKQPADTRPQPAPPPAISAADLDEFDDDFGADDFDDDALNNIEIPKVVTMTSKPTTTAKPADTKNDPVPVNAATNAATKQDVKAPQTIDLTGMSDDFDDDIMDTNDDEFGLDEMDEQGFLQAEMSATQGMNHRASPSMKHMHNSAHRTKLHPSQASHLKPKSQPSQRLSQSRNASSIPHSTAVPTKYRRFHVRKIEASNNGSIRSAEKLVLAEDHYTKVLTAITLKGSWADTSLGVNDVIHVAKAPALSNDNTSSAPGQILVDDSELSPLLIVHPDHMLSATTVADSFDCIRKAVLQDRVKATSDASKAMIYGKILHAIFQQALLSNTWDESSLNSLVQSTVKIHLEGLWELGMQDEMLAMEEITAKMAEMAAWAGIFVRSIPGADGKVQGSKAEAFRIAVSGLVAIEEHIWSPMFGIKGNVDATVQLVEKSTSSKLCVAPFEVKTGRSTASSAHLAQTSLYTLLLSDRYDVAVKAGILYYLEDSKIIRVSPSLFEIKQMIQQRNRLASYINHARSTTIDRKDDTGLSQLAPSGRLPDMLKSPFRCDKCYAQTSCFTFHALEEGGNAESAGMIDDKRKNHSDIWKAALSHLLAFGKQRNQVSNQQEEQLKQWFTKWNKLLTFEESESSRLIKELWTMSSRQRESAGRCFGNLRLFEVPAQNNKTKEQVVDGIEGLGTSQINRFSYILQRKDGHAGKAFNDASQLVVGEPIVISAESGQWALANGYVTAVTNHSISVAVDRKLGDARQRAIGFDTDNNQLFKGVMHVDRKVNTAQNEGVLFRLDKDEFSNGLARVRNTLVTLMSSHPTHTRLRELIIFNKKPKFTTDHRPHKLQPSQIGEMNEDQKAAAAKVIAADDYALVLGMPGTGKTTTIAHLIRALLADGKSILLTSYTHTAVDNILLKIRDTATEGSILRLGSPAKMNPTVKEFCHTTTSSFNSIDEIDQIYMSTQIVATTCMGVNHALFSRRAFDVCIVDEASQITLPISLGPLLYARKFILVGDHYQLPPLVQNRTALEGGLDISLFRQLSEQRPESIATLGKQYRMCRDIMSISSTLIYDGRLECANETVANRRMAVLQAANLSLFHDTGAACVSQSQCWLYQMSNPSRQVIFANTDNLGDSAREVLTGESTRHITNRLEAVLIAQLIVSLQAQGIAGKDIGVIALYRSQIALLRELFDTAAIGREVEIDSVDRFQGRDKECIIISMVRSNNRGHVGDLIKDWRRINVAFTRARSKLIVFGSRSTLRQNDLMAKFLELADQKSWSLNLPADAEGCHGTAFEKVTQATGKIAVHETVSQVKKEIGTPGKKVNASPRKSQVLQVSKDGLNRGLFERKSPSGKQSGIVKRIDGRKEGRVFEKNKKMKENLAFEFFEDFEI